MKMINSSYFTYSEDCWYYHLNKSLLIKDDAHWYNQDIEVKFLGNLFILKTDMSTFPFDSNYTLMGMAGSWLMLFILYISQLPQVCDFYYSHDFHNFPSKKTMKYNDLPIFCGMTASTVWSVENCFPCCTHDQCSMMSNYNAPFPVYIMTYKIITS